MGIAERGRLQLYGPFRLEHPSGRRIDCTSRKGAAMLAMLALAPEGERTRAWLMDRLWGSRGRQQAQSSFRRELSQMRALLDTAGLPLLSVQGDRVRLDLSAVDLLPPASNDDELLEGFDLPGEEGFEDWLRQHRTAAPAIARPPVPPVASIFHRNPALAILPFANLTGDRDQAYLSDGIGEQLIDMLSRLRWLPIVSPGHSFVPGGAESAVDAGRRLGVAYVLEGRLRQQHASYWLSAQLSDTATGQLVWSGLTEVPAPQAHQALAPLVMELAAALGDRIGAAEMSRALAAPGIDLPVADLLWRGRWHQERLTAEDTAIAGDYFRESYERAPNSPQVVIELLRHRIYVAWNGRMSHDDLAPLRDLAERARVLDPNDAWAWHLSGVVEMWRRDFARAEHLLTQAIAINPSHAQAHEQLGTLLVLHDRPDEGIARIETALKLCPNDHRLFYREGELGLAHLLAGRPAEALAHAMRSLTLRPRYWHAHVTRIAANRLAGNATAMAEAWEELHRQRPGFQLDYIDWIPFRDPSRNAWLKESVEAAMPTRTAPC